MVPGRTAVPPQLPSPVLEDVLGNKKMPSSRATKQLLGCSAALFVVLLSVPLLGVVTKRTIRDSVPGMIPTRVVLDASENANAVKLLIDAQMGTTNKALHVVRPRGGTCSVKGECGSGSRDPCILLVATVQEFTYPDDSQMRFVAAVEQAWSSNIRAALEHDGHGMVVSCELSIDVNLFTLGYVITKQVQWHSKQMDATKFLQLEQGYTNGARPHFRVKQMHTHKDGRIVQSKTISNFSVAKHFIAELTLPLASMVTALESTSVGVKAHIGYREEETRALEGCLAVNSNLEIARNTSAGEAVLSLPFHVLLRGDLPNLAKGAFQSFFRPGTLNEHGDERHSTMERTMLFQASPGSRAAASILGETHSIGWSSERRETLKRNQLAPASFGAKMPPGARRLISILGIELQNLAMSHRLRIDDNQILQVDVQLLEGPPLAASVDFNLQLTDSSVTGKASLSHHNVQETIEAKVSVLATSNGKVDLKQDLVASMDLKADTADADIHLQVSDSTVANLKASYRGNTQLALVNVDISGKDSDGINGTAKISGDFDDLIFLVDATVQDAIVVKFDGREDVVKLNGTLLGDEATTLLVHYTRVESQDIERFTVSMDIAETFEKKKHNNTEIKASANSNMTMSFSMDHGRRRTTSTGGIARGLGRIRMTPTCQATGMSGNAAMCTSGSESKSCCKDSLQDIMVSLADNVTLTIGQTYTTEGLTVQMTNLKQTSEDMDMIAYLDINDKTMPVVEGNFRKVNGRNSVKCTLKENSTTVTMVGDTAWEELSDGYTGNSAIADSKEQIMEGAIMFKGKWDGDIDVTFHLKNETIEFIRGIGDWNSKSDWGADLTATVFAFMDDKNEKIMALADISEANDVRTLSTNVKHNEKPVLSALMHVSDGGGARPCFVNATINEGEQLAFLARAYGNITNPNYALDTLANRQVTLTHPIQGSFNLDIRDEGRVVTASTAVTKQDVAGGNVVKASLQATISKEAVTAAVNFATTDGVHMIVSGDVKVGGDEKASVSGTLKEIGDWRQGDLTIAAGDDKQIVWARGSKMFLTQEMKPAGFDALWFNFGTEIGSDVKLNLTDLYFERGPDIAWSGFGLTCQISDMNGSQWKELYQGKLDVDFVPGVAPVKSGNFAATNLKVAFTVPDLGKMKMSDVIKSIAQASGVSASDVVVKTMKFKVAVTSAFDVSVTLPQARSTIATANSVQESQVNVSEVTRRRLSAEWLTKDVLPSFVGRRLASRQLKSVITTTDATQAASVQTTAANTTKLTQALKQVVPSAPPPTITVTPSVSVELETQVLSNSLTPVAAPSETALTQSLTQNMGQQVQAQVTNLGSSSCTNGVCGAPGSGGPPGQAMASAAAPLSIAVLPLLMDLLLVLAGSYSV